MDNQKKRNLSDLSDTSSGSPISQPKKSIKMSLDTFIMSETDEVMHQEMDNFEEKIKNMSLDEKVDEILKTVKAQQVQNVLDVTALQSENRELQLKLQQSNGIVSRLASKVSMLEEKVVTMESHAMKKNIIIYNIPETNGEDIHKETENFLSSILKIPETVLFSKASPGTEIRIDVAHRIGRKGAKPRPIVVSFTTQQGRNMVLSTPRVVKNSVFQRHYYPIHTKQDAMQMLRALHQNDLAQSHHLIYAYRLLDTDGQALSGHSDDGEWGASNILKDLLQRHGQSNAILVVSRKFGGIKLGKQRFELIKQVAGEVLPNE